MVAKSPAVGNFGSALFALDLLRHGSVEVDHSVWILLTTHFMIQTTAFRKDEITKLALDVALHSGYFVAVGSVDL